LKNTFALAMALALRFARRDRAVVPQIEMHYNAGR
jgi:hypothetical protein